jgi:hypothetical protein
MAGSAEGKAWGRAAVVPKYFQEGPCRSGAIRPRKAPERFSPQTGQCLEDVMEQKQAAKHCPVSLIASSGREAVVISKATGYGCILALGQAISGVYTFHSPFCFQRLFWGRPERYLARFSARAATSVMIPARNQASSLRCRVCKGSKRLAMSTVFALKEEMRRGAMC